MNLYIDNHTFHYEMENLLRAFFPYDKISVKKECENIEKPYVFTSINDTISVTVSFEDFKKTLSTKKKQNSDEDELVMAQLMYALLCEYFDTTLPWGILTGVRPIKLLRRFIEAYGEDYAREYFLSEFKVSQKKLALALITQKCESAILSLSQEKSFSLYISIPFCPSRCNYCSFVSQSIEKAKHLIDDYVKLLCDELKLTAKIAKDLGFRLETVYMGGGTPTTLSAQQMDLVLSTVNEHFDMSTCREFTVEAGRPDTISKEKLIVIKKNKVTRISINPQTLNDEVLSIIGRRHSAQDAIDAFYLARECGFENINMDLIAGLKGDNYNSFVDTLDKIRELSPESITIHTLALKRSSTLNTENIDINIGIKNETTDMLEYSQKVLMPDGFVPYYLYRQSRMAGNLENVGWSKRGCESLYNVYVMDETHTILACGAGGVTKLKDHKSDKLERIFNFKFPYEYNTRFNELMERKDAIYSFYDEFFSF
ncbi:MAG: coproporphyrinogen dehydrogenase HemZ [Ruminococcaceae bacterium]|nr:coproporphyrinogen dehydrogenase HemZ [Oscillospiraceae bacterium]